MDARLQIKPTAHAGNGVFATTAIPSGTLILTSPPPSLSVIYKAYRKETCGYCFKYNLGRHWKIKSSNNNNSNNSSDNDNKSRSKNQTQSLETGIVFCSVECCELWEEDVGLLGVACYAAVEKVVRANKTTVTPEEEEEDDKSKEKELKAEDLKAAWLAAEPLASRIVKLRKSKPGALGNLMRGIPVDWDVLSFLVSGVLALHRNRTEDDVAANAGLEKLYVAPVPYAFRAQLDAHVNSYFHLLAILPEELQDLVTPAKLQYIAGVSYSNAFGIRSIDHTVAPNASSDIAPVLEEPGSEVLGWAVFPSASFFNHSCAPSILKVRHGRIWRFWTARDIKEGEEVSITYLGGDEKDLGVEDRRERLNLGWEFDCACARCKEDLAMKG